MGLAEILHGIKGELGKGDEDKVLAEGVRTHFKQHQDLKKTIQCKNAATKAYKYYEQIDADESKSPTYEDETNATEQTTEIRSTANRFRTTTNRRRNLMVTAAYPPEAKVNQDVPSAADKTEEANKEVEDSMRKLEWKDVVKDRSKDLLLSASTFIYLGMDTSAGEIDQIPGEDLVEVPEPGAEPDIDNAEVVPPRDVAIGSGEHYFELLQIGEVSLDKEATKFRRSRTVTIRRQKTREQLLVAFPRKRKEIGELKAKTRSSTIEVQDTDGNTRDVKIDDPYDLYEVLVNPEPNSEHYPGGLHAFIVGDLILQKDEEVDWQRDSKYRPIELYICETKKGTCLGSSPLWQLFGLQVIENLCLEIMLASAMADVPGKFYEENLFDAKLYPSNDPSEWIPCNAPPAGKIYVTERASVAPAVVQVYNRVLQTWEELTQMYDLKHRFPSKSDRKVGELQMLNEREQQSYTSVIGGVWEGDKRLWQTLYRMKHPGEQSAGIDFVISTSNLPQSNAVKRANLVELADMGVFGQPGSPEYVRIMRNILDHNDDLPSDPIMHLHELAAKKIVRWIEVNAIPTLDDTPETVAEKVWIDENWNLSQIGIELDQWSLEHGEALNEFQRKVWGLVRFNLKKLAVGKQFKEAMLAKMAQTSLGQMFGQSDGQGAVAQQPTEVDEVPEQVT